MLTRRNSEYDFAMSNNDSFRLSVPRILERVTPGAPGLADLSQEMKRVLDGLALSSDSLRGKRIAVAVGSRGIASIDILVSRPI